MVARVFRSSTTVTLDGTTVADILLVGGGAAGSANSKGGDPGTVILQLGYILVAGTYTISLGQGGLTGGAKGGDTILGSTAAGNLFVARGGSGSLATNNVVNGIAGIGPTVSSSYVVVENLNAASGLRQIDVPDRDAPYVLCIEMGVFCDMDVAAPGKNAGADAAALPNTGSGGSGGSSGGQGGSGLVVIRMLSTSSSSSLPNIAGCMADCQGMQLGSVFTTGTYSIPFLTDTVVDLLLIGGGAGGTTAAGGGAGEVQFYRGFLVPAGSYNFVVGTGGSAGANGGDTYISTGGLGTSILIARGGKAAGGAAGGGPGVVGYAYATFGGNAGGQPFLCSGSPCQPGGGGGAGGSGGNASSSSSPGAGGAGIVTATLKAGETFNLCTYFANMALNLPGGVCSGFAEGGKSSLSSVSSLPGSGGWLATVPGSSGLIAIQNAVAQADLPALCYGMCMEAALRGRFCPVGTYLNASRACVPCAKNTYRDLSMQDGRQCTPCLAGFVTAGAGAASALACKNWCFASRKEMGLVTVDTFPKVYLAGSNGTAAVLSKV